MHPTMGSQTRRRAFGRDPSVPGRAPRAPSETRPAPRLAPRYADAVLKGYATAISVLLTGVLSMVLFGTELSVEYALGMTNVLAAVFLYNAQDLEKHAW